MATSKDISSLRRHDLDNLRSFLTCLVVVHHTGATYGGAGMGAPFKSSLLPARFVSLPLWHFDAFNQSFFMGLFFWMSGRVSAQSLYRIDGQGRGRGRFLRNKLKRLLLPAIVYTGVINPCVRVLSLPEWNASSVAQCVANYFGSINGIKGPVWFTATLFAFDVVSAMIIPKRNVSGQSRKDTGLVQACYRLLASWGWVAVAAISFTIRIWYPVGRVLLPLNIQPAYAVQYVFAYIMGHLSFKYGPQTFPGPFSPNRLGAPTDVGHSRLLLASVLSAISLSFVLLPKFILGPEQWMKEAMSDISGGLNLTALVYALWSEFSFVLVGPALMAYFYKWHRKLAESWIWQPRYSYAAFLLHYVVSIPVERAVDVLLLTNGVEAPPWTRNLLFGAVGPTALTAFVGIINAVGSFALGRLVVDYIPGVDGVL